MQKIECTLRMATNCLFGKAGESMTPLANGFRQTKRELRSPAYSRRGLGGGPYSPFCIRIFFAYFAVLSLLAATQQVTENGRAHERGDYADLKVMKKHS